MVKASTNDFNRLEKQYDKQLLAYNSGLMNPILVPKVVGQWDGTSFRMLFAPGTPLGFFLGTASPKQALKVAESLGAYFARPSKNLAPREKYSVGLHNKFRQIESYLAANGLDWAMSLLEWTETHISAQTSLPIAWHHGDFSFENLLVAQGGKEIWAIDFLDSPIESPLIDLGRIWLDSEFGWWKFHMKRNSNRLLNEQALATALRGSVLFRDNGQQLVEAFSALALLRMIPYTISPIRMGYLKSTSHKIVRRYQH